MKFRYLSRGLVLSIVATLGVAITARAADWLSVRDTDLAVQAGSVLDLSSLVEAGPAGKHGAAVVLPDGHIGFENRRTAQRFFCASFAFSPASGGFPDKDRAALVVTQLVRSGYNAVRLQNVDANLMSGRARVQALCSS